MNEKSKKKKKGKDSKVTNLMVNQTEQTFQGYKLDMQMGFQWVSARRTDMEQGR